MKRIKFFVKDHSINEILGSNLTYKDAYQIMKTCKNKKHTRMYMEEVK